MENFIVSARKYRPTVFDDVVGQQAIANTLKRAIINHKLAGAYLFCGPRGVGKTTCARIFAKAINCLNPQADGESCNTCESCLSFNEGRSMNVQELNAAANNSVEDIRSIIEQVRIPPQLGHYKVIILDEVHMLSQGASNALLKILEEPPSYVVFILATTEKQKIIPTILSRCQIFDFNRMEVENIVGQLKMVAEKEGIEYEEAALNVIAQKADGGMRDSLSIFDQVTSFSNGKITYESVLRCLNVLDYEYYFKMTDFLLGHKVSDAMLLFNEVVGKGFDGGLFISGLASHFRDLLVSRNPETTELLDVAGNIRQQYAEQAQRCAPKFLYRAIRTCDRCANGYKTSCNKRLSVEITLIEVAQIDTPDDLDGACGLGPTKPLKPIFKATNPQPQAVQVSPATAQPKHEAVANRPVTDNTPTAPAANPQKAEAPTQPAEKPKPAAPRTPIDPALIMQQLGGISIRPLTQSVAAPEPKPIAEPTPAVPEEKDDAPIANTPISKPALDNAWAQISSTQEDPVLRGRMQAMEFRFEAPSTIHLVVHNEGARKLFQEAIPSLRQQFARTLNNQLLSIDLIIEEVKDDYIIEDDATRLVRMLKTHPGLVDLYKDLSLVLD